MNIILVLNTYLNTLHNQPGGQSTLIEAVFNLETLLIQSGFEKTVAVNEHTYFIFDTDDSIAYEKTLIAIAPLVKDLEVIFNQYQYLELFKKTYKVDYPFALSVSESIQAMSYGSPAYYGLSSSPAPTLLAHGLSVDTHVAYPHDIAIQELTGNESRNDLIELLAEGIINSTKLDSIKKDYKALITKDLATLSIHDLLSTYSTLRHQDIKSSVIQKIMNKIPMGDFKPS